MTRVKGFLIDIDGVLYTGKNPIKGAIETINLLVREGYQFRLVSNSTRKCRKTIAERLVSMGFRIPEENIFTPPLAAIAYIKRTNKRNFHLLTMGDVDRDFEQVCEPNPGGKPDLVIIGDAGDEINYKNMNVAFHYIMEGAELIALERDRYWMADDGLSLSAGPFVAALEFATGKTAKVMGKPSKDFFDLALSDMELGTDETVMIGDDIITDIGGARSAGMDGILVRTGKFQEDTLRKAAIKPSYVIDSITYLPDILQSL
jgi:HAD superfamily hydrolase (TIGR01458 family)